jgi:hypothetical protein
MSAVWRLNRSYASKQEIPRLYRIEQHESLAVSKILALHGWAGWMDGIYVSRRFSHHSLTELN